MAALVPGVQYGLSSSGNFVENKELIFVKLTDSAYKAIQDYLKNKVSRKHLISDANLGKITGLVFGMV